MIKFSYCLEKGVRNLNTILLDLDGTLLPLDMALFEKIYFEGLSKALADLIPPKETISLIWGSTKVMVKNTDFRTNEEVFMEDFAKHIDGDLDLYQTRFAAFYDNEFHNVKASVREVLAMKESIHILKAKGYKIVLATNPLFPQKALHTRIKWAGFEPSDFAYMSTFEKSHYCKPQLKYYEEILQDINKSAVECLMVGNDVQEDLVVQKLGIKTYLITDNMLHRTEEEIVTDYKGTYEDFYEFVKTLPLATS